MRFQCDGCLEVFEVESEDELTDFETPFEVGIEGGEQMIMDAHCADQRGWLRLEPTDEEGIYSTVETVYLDSAPRPAGYQDVNIRRR